ncbi:universal stress protein [Methylopila sp. Yamaguchi]|uniref:universal stress protein n=1 Tax=Methylopila sp. Yamaguchi TaxID=1437817 RepID=UPI000CA676E1|nr:universal stress protein [Methylopila sp. Yamaguchi]GBD49623.1 UspA domain-containing protein [Methylopila sp. Yamaguchi]
MPKVANIKNVLIALNEEGEGRPSDALSYGLALGKATDAHVSVQAASVKLDIPSAHGSAVVAGLVHQENRRLQELTRRIAETTRAEGAMAGLICEVDAPQLTYAELKAAALAQARVNDVVVVDADPSAMTVDGGLLRALVFESGRPVIVVPRGSQTFACDRIVVAWDASAAAARAVAAALPFLKAAASVEIVCYVGDKDVPRSAAGADLAVALVRHGVNATVKELPAGNDVGARLREQAGIHRADLIVMGAFVHSPIREWIFGGVTQEMLKNSGAPLLVAR